MKNLLVRLGPKAPRYYVQIFSSSDSLRPSSRPPLPNSLLMVISVFITFAPFQKIIFLCILQWYAPHTQRLPAL